jgi:hypothetical protein
MKLSIAGSMTSDPSLTSLDFDVTYVPPCRPPVQVIRRTVKVTASPAMPTHTRSESGAIVPIGTVAPVAPPAWWLVVRSVSGSLRVSQECNAGERIEYQHRDRNAAERFLAGISTSAYKSGKVSSPAVTGRGRAVFCPLEGKA